MKTIRWLLLAALAVGMSALSACGDDDGGGGGTDTDTDTDADGGIDGGDQAECDDLIPCTETDGGTGTDYECEGEPEIQCYNMTYFCDAFLCATHEQACQVACHADECSELDTDPPIPDCDSL